LGRIFLILCVILLTSFQYSDTVFVSHTNFKTTFSKSYRYPIVVEWWLTNEMINCVNPIKRKDSFKSDPKISKYTNLSKYYRNSGYDRGHMMPAADNLCQTKEIQEECFYFSNISPQNKKLNGGDWKSLEQKIRKYSLEYDSIHVWSGNIGQIEKIGIVSVPKYCWKVIHIKSQNIKMAYIFKNDEINTNGIDDNSINIEVIERLTNIKFN
jgi:endonuclease G